MFFSPHTHTRAQTKTHINKKHTKIHSPNGQRWTLKTENRNPKTTNPIPLIALEISLFISTDHNNTTNNDSNHLLSMPKPPKKKTKPPTQKKTHPSHPKTKNLQKLLHCSCAKWKWRQIALTSDDDNNKNTNNNATPTTQYNNDLKSETKLTINTTAGSFESIATTLVQMANLGKSVTQFKSHPCSTLQ